MEHIVDLCPLTQEAKLSLGIADRTAKNCMVTQSRVPNLKSLAQVVLKNIFDRMPKNCRGHVT